MFARLFFHSTGRSASRCFESTVSSSVRPGISNASRRGATGIFFNFQAGRPRAYRRQAFNYQTFQSTSNIFKRWAARRTFYYEVGGVTTVGAGIYVVNLETVPVSGRRRFNIVSPKWEASLGETMYKQTMQEYGNRIMPEYTLEHRLVQRVLDRLIPASGLPGDWEIHVIKDDNQANAFVIPGGKVFVFSGIFKMTQNDDGMAAVLGHEIAHNIARHAAERTSQSGILIPVAIVGSMLFGLDPGIGKFGMDIAFSLPGSRKQEGEADYIGLLLMAECCYDPRAALGLWSRMEQAENGRAPPPFLSTHPSSHNRLEKIQEWLPQAQAKLEASECGSIAGYANEFRQKLDYAKF